MSDFNQHDAHELSRTCDVERVSHWVRSAIAIMEPCAAAGPPVPVNGAFGHVVFDVDVDGYRYLLLRTAKLERGGFSLSPREREIVRMVALGHPNKVIAGVLCISSWTVCTHVRRIFAKLDVNSRAAMVAKVTEFGWIPESRDKPNLAAEFRSAPLTSADAALRRDDKSSRSALQPSRSITRKAAATARSD